MTDDRLASRPADQSEALPRANNGGRLRRPVESIKDYATQIGIRLGRARAAARGNWDLGWMTLRALLIYLPLAALATVAFYLIYENDAAESRDLMKVRQEKMVDLGQMIFSTAFASIAGDVRYLAEEPSLRRWIATRDPKWREALIEQYLSFAKYQRHYDQIRLIDVDGREVVRINRNSGTLTAASDDQLQDKSSRYYVREGMKLAAGEIYVSAFDLNVENGAIEQPIKPTIRLAAPVFDANGRRQGLIVLNFLGESLLSEMRRLATKASGDIWLVNNSGDWLIGPRPQDEWTFMYPGRENRSFARMHPNVWKSIESMGGSGQFVSGRGFFSFASIAAPATLNADESHASKGQGLPYLFAVARIPLPLRANAALGRNLMLAWCGLLLMVAVVAIAIAYHGARRRTAERTIHRLNERLSQDNVKLAEANKELEAFSYSVSHDLRAPLRAIDGFSRILLKKYGPTLSEEPREYLQLVHDNTVQMGHLVDDLLRLSKLGRQPLSKQQMPTGGIIERVLRDARLQAEGRCVNVSVGKLPTICGDPALLKQVFVNLVDNAFKYTRRRADAAVEIGSREIDGEQVFYVRDNGVGFDMKYADQLFSAFQRLHRAEDFEGTGVGLAIVQRIIQRHGGRIWADAAVDKGATFYFTTEASVHA